MSAKERLRLALEVCQGKHLRNTDTHVQQPSDKITSKAKQVRQAADAGGRVGGLKGAVGKTGKAPRRGAKKQGACFAWIS